MPSEEIVDRVRAVCREWAKGNWRAGGELLDPAVVLVAQVPEGYVTSDGPEGVSRFMGEFLSQWEHWRFEAQRFVDAGDKLLVIGRQYGAGSMSGVRMDETTYVAFTFDGGRVTEMRWTFDRAVALEAAGLSESELDAGRPA